MKLAVLLLLAILGALAEAQEPRLWFVFLVKGDGVRPGSDELAKMQKEHLDNFGRQFEAGKLLMAGPLRDPTTVKRGITAMWATDREDLMRCFADDRYVTSGIMNVVARPWKMDRARINTELPDPDSIEENRLVLLTARRTVPAYLMRQHRAYMDQLKPSLGGELEGDRFSEVILLHGTDDARARKAIYADPLVRLGWVDVEYMPLWIAKGVLRPW